MQLFLETRILDPPPDRPLFRAYLKGRMKEQVPGRGSQLGLDLQAAEDQVAQGGGEAGGDLRRCTGARYLNIERGYRVHRCVLTLY